MPDHIELGYLLDSYGELLTERQRMLIEQSAYEDLSLSEIAEREGISRQGVRDSLMRSEAQLLDIEAKIGMIRRNMQLMEGIARMDAMLDEMEIAEQIKMKLKNELNALREAVEG
ncbi:MAG: sigma factor-like helix-turn-helix DNA-binding protein [Clostridia bacterium]